MEQQFFKSLIVLDHSRYLTGGLASQVLADLGCEVIKIEEMKQGDFCRQEPPMRNGIGSHFVAIGRNKKSLTLNLKSEKGQEAYMRLAKKADIVLENYRPGMLDKLGIGYEAIRAINPKIIHCSITAFGKDDPRSLKATHDANFQALSGFQDINQNKTTPLHLCDISTLTAALQSMLVALCQRSLTGEGSFCDTRMNDSFVWWQTLLYQRWQFNGESQTYRDIEYPAVGYNYLETKDNRWFSIAMVEKKFWISFCKDAGVESCINDHLKREWEAPETFALLRALFNEKTFEEWKEWFEGKDYCSAPVLSMGEAIDYHLHQENNQVQYCFFPDTGDTLQVRSPIYVSSIPIDIKKASAPPRLGEHNQMLLESLGFLDTEIKEMADAGDCGALQPV